ncbi:MAG: glutamate-5-semialdehyde dehydrogenase, partial [Dehalococcoidia bacterium]
IAGRRRVPLGVIACIYESRPNVTVDIASLALKSGNACVLRGGKEAVESNSALAAAIGDGLAQSHLPREAVQVITDPDRSHVEDLLRAHDLVDLMIPRGGHGLITRVRDQATMPVVAGGVGVVHIFVDARADLEMALDIVHNAKTRRYSICNAVDTVLVDREISLRFLPLLGQRWAGRVTMLADAEAATILESSRIDRLEVEEASGEDWDTEHLALRVGIAVVGGLDGALEHIAEHGSGHSEAIVTESYGAAMRFLNDVDAAAVYVNASTQFTDGAQFGLGAEVGISTQKMHARGPMGLRELTSYKWTILGTGQVRAP